MPAMFWTMTWIAGVLAAAAVAIVAALQISTPDPAMHASITQACNGPVEIAAVIGADPAALAAMQGAHQSNGTQSGANGSLPITARVAGGQYVVTVGTGNDTKTCLVPLATTHL